MPKGNVARILLSCLGDRRASFVSKVGIYFTHVLGVEVELQHNITVDIMQ